MLSAIRSDASGCAGGYSTLFFADDTPENIDSAQRLLDRRVRTILVDVGCDFLLLRLSMHQAER